MKDDVATPCYLVYMPKSYRGTSRDLLVSADSMTLEGITSSEAYSYRTCMAYKETYTERYPSPHDFGPTVYIGSMLTRDDLLHVSSSWTNAFPHKYAQSDSIKARGSYRRMLDTEYSGRVPIALAVDRYGRAHPMYDGDSIEPVDWNEVQPMRVQITPKKGFNSDGEPYTYPEELT